MFVSPAFKLPVFQAREDRRRHQRSAYPAVVGIDGCPAAGRDISSQGLSAFIAAPVVGQVVRVTLAGAPGDPEEISSQARILRVERTDHGFVVGLEFRHG